MSAYTDLLSDFFRFRTMVSLGLLRLVYVFGLLGLIVYGVLLIGQGQGVLGLLAIIGGNLAWRVGCEYLILFFSMHELLGSIDGELRRKVDAGYDG